MMYLIVSLISFILIFLIYYIRDKFSFLNESPISNNRKLHTEDVTRIGGIIFFSNLIIFLYITDVYLKSVLLFGFFILILGLIEDIYRNISKYLRLFILLLLCTIFVEKNNFIINDFENIYLNYIFDLNESLKILFSIVGLIILINGFNFIDGLNGLLLGLSIIILTTLALYSLPHSGELSTMIIALLLPIIILFFINFFGGVVLTGDGGSYFLGFIVGCICITISNYRILGSFEIACIIFYPVMEILFSVIRRISTFSNPLKPDGLHLHQLLYRVVSYKVQNKSDFFLSKNINSLSSIIILISVSILIAIHHLLLKNTISDTITFSMFCFLYLLSYNLLITYCYKKNILKIL